MQDIRKQIIRWTLIGLLLRLLLMPFSFHGSDVLFIYHAPFKFIAYGIWNPYIKTDLSNSGLYYAPVIFFTISFFLVIFQQFLPNLANLFSDYASFFPGGGNTVHYADVLLRHQLFRTLFIFKIPYLFFDFGAGVLLLKILNVEEKKKLLAYKIWMLNPFILHSCYMLGQVDVIPAFLLMAAIYTVYIKRKYWTMILLSLATMAKLFPVSLTPIAVLLLADTFRERVKLSLVFLASVIAIELPFYLSSINAITELFLARNNNIVLFRSFLSVASYSAILGSLLFVKKEGRMNLDFIILCFTSVLLLLYAFYIVTIRYFVFITPLLIYAAIKNKGFWIYNIIFFITLFLLRTGGNSQQGGLFAALHPEFFSSLPILDSYLNLAINVKIIHQVCFRAFVIASLIVITHIIIINRRLFVFKLNFGKKNG